eukprot:976209-Prorocentrum_lima.AAC.1
MAVDHEPDLIPPFSLEGVKSKVGRLHKAKSHVAEALKVAEEIEDDGYKMYYEDRFDSDSLRSPCEPSITSMVDFELWTVERQDNVYHTQQ